MTEPLIISETEVKGLNKKKTLRGWLCERDDGEKVYYAKKKFDDIFRMSYYSISGALTAGEACWGIAESLLINMRSKKVKYVGVRVTDTGAEYITELSNYFDRTKFKIRDYTGHFGGIRQRYLPNQFFILKKGIVKFDVGTV